MGKKYASKMNPGKTKFEKENRRTIFPNPTDKN